MLRHARVLISFALAVTFLAGCASAASISPTVSPTRGGINAEYAFVLRYTGQLPAASAQVYIDDVPHPMREVDPNDTNHTNGKDYSFVAKLPEGAHVYYILLVDANGTEYRTSAGIVVVDPLLDWGHVDVALAVLVFMIPLLYALFLLRKAAKALEKVARRLGEGGAKEPGKNDAGPTEMDSPPLPPQQG